MIAIIQCKDRVGLVASIASEVAQEKINIVSMREHVDKGRGLFFARLELDNCKNAVALKEKLQAILPPDSFINIHAQPIKRIAILATKEYHCLGDILMRHHFKTLGAQVACVLANHPDLEDLCTRFDIPFFHVSHDNKEKPEFEAALRSILDKYILDYIVLAKFMRILSHNFVSHFQNKIINIHHSFLPAFIGTNPYRQAYERGVKIIGATAHFVTSDLDKGPIIVQRVTNVNHTHSVPEIILAGRETEKAALSEALDLVLDDRVFVYDNKTVVFD